MGDEMNRHHDPEIVAVVTGANKGIGLEIVKQLLQNGLTVVLTARDIERGTAAVESVRHHFGGLNRIVFHQLDVCDPASAASLAEFILSRFGKLDVLVNNAGASGLICDEKTLKAMNIDPKDWLSGKATKDVQYLLMQTYEGAKVCLDTNYYGCKRVVEALLPLLQLSPSGANVVNVTSLRSELKRIPNKVIRDEIGDLSNLTEEKIDKLLDKFMEAIKNGKLESEGWPLMLPAYSMSKVTLNAYTRLLSIQYPKMRVNCVHPGYVDTDLNWHTGLLTAEEGAKGPVMLALLTENDNVTGHYFDQINIAEF